MAQEDEPIEFTDFKPVLLAPAETTKASNALFGPIQDVFLEEMAVIVGHQIWLNNTANLTNVTEVA